MNDEQATLWNGEAGRAWVETEELTDRVFEAIRDRMVEAVVVGSESRVLDVGCGTGGTTVAAARRLGAGGLALGVDISAPMIEAARARAAREGSTATFLCGDAQSQAFEEPGFDLILSRFGVMFFEDTVAAFANLRRAASGDAELRLFAWRRAEENPFMTTAERAAAPLLSNLPERKPDAPGQFAFADAQRVRRFLENAGWSGVDIQAVDIACTFPESELIRYITRFGPLGRALHEVDDSRRASIIERVRLAFEPFVHGDTVRFDAACWQIGASVSHSR